MFLKTRRVYVRFHTMQFASSCPCVIFNPNTPLSGFSPYLIFCNNILNGRELMLLALPAVVEMEKFKYHTKIILQQGETLTFSSPDFYVYTSHTPYSKSISTCPITRGCRRHSLVSMITARSIILSSALVIIVPGHVFGDEVNNVLSTNFSPGKSLPI